MMPYLSPILQLEMFNEVRLSLFWKLASVCIILGKIACENLLEAMLRDLRPTNATTSNNFDIPGSVMPVFSKLKLLDYRYNRI